MVPAYDRSVLIALIKDEFKWDWHWIHGASHCARVLHHGKSVDLTCALLSATNSSLDTTRF